MNKMKKDILLNIIDPALETLSKYAFPVPYSQSARAMMYAIGMQESRFLHRFQLPQPNAANRKGPARGLWQFEAMGGVDGVLKHPATKERAEFFARSFVGSINPHAVWATLEYEDMLAAIFARLLLLSDPNALPDPKPASEDAAWNCYIRNWRPGAPHRETWGKIWAESIAVIN